mmetsp:Transcript_12829/g.19273  ORF Transcript_12829/g.19273 Transcript_12829/m.19273 type:complete len:436 (+) Transcript_12829:1-1308(+)
MKFIFSIGIATYCAFSNAVEFQFSLSLLSAHNSPPLNATIEYLVQNNFVESFDWGCLYGCHHPHHSTNKWHDLEVNKSEALKDPAFLRGTTFWVNEHMNVGHVMYDIALIQVLQSTHVDRIVLQRAPCMNMNLCAGIGTFETFFKGFYIAMLEAANITAPIFVRWTWQEKVMKPLYVTSHTLNNYLDDRDMPLLSNGERKEKNIILTPVKCFERMIRKNTRCHGCFYPSISIDAVIKFKKVAYSLVRIPSAVPISSSSSSSSSPTTMPLPAPLLHSFNKSLPISITHAYRGPFASRHIANIEFIQNLLYQAFPSPKYSFQSINSSNDQRGYAEQIQMVAESQIIITEHGAFQSNLIYMRNGSLLIDLRGDYRHAEFMNFQNLAQMFGVFVVPVVTKGLTSHAYDEFNISASEVKEIIDIVHLYLNSNAYSFNTVH